MKSYKNWIVLICVFVDFFGASQQVMTYENYKFLVLKNHPFLQKAYNIQMLDMQYREYGDAEPVRGRRPRPPVMNRSSY